MLRLLLAYIAYFDTTLTDGVYNLRDLTSARSGFAVPDSCEAWIDLHLPALTNMGQLTFQLEELHAEYLSANPGIEATIHFNTIHTGYALPRKGPLVALIEAICKRRGLIRSDQFPQSQRCQHAVGRRNQADPAGTGKTRKGPHGRRSDCAFPRSNWRHRCTWT